MAQYMISLFLLVLFKCKLHRLKFIPIELVFNTRDILAHTY